MSNTETLPLKLSASEESQLDSQDDVMTELTTNAFIDFHSLLEDHCSKLCLPWHESSTDDAFTPAQMHKLSQSQRSCLENCYSTSLQTMIIIKDRMIEAHEQRKQRLGAWFK